MLERELARAHRHLALLGADERVRAEEQRGRLARPRARAGPTSASTTVAIARRRSRSAARRRRRPRPAPAASARPAISSNSDDVDALVARSRSRSQRPHSSSPAPPASATSAPARAATTATFADRAAEVRDERVRLGELARPAARRSGRRAPRRGTACASAGGSDPVSLTARTLSSPRGCASTSTRSNSPDRPSSTAARPAGTSRLCTCTASRPAPTTGRVPRADRRDRARPARLRPLGQGRHLDYSLAGLTADFIERLLDAARARAGRARRPRLGRRRRRSCSPQRHPERVERLVLCNALPLLDGFRWPRLARMLARARCSASC